MTGNRILVCGGRAFADHVAVETVLDHLAAARGDLVIIQGGADGADRWARRWAEYHRHEYMNFPPDWKTHGKAAGPIRNQRMIDVGRPDLVIAFPGGNGTADMVRRAEAAGIEVRRIEPGSNS